MSFSEKIKMKYIIINKELSKIIIFLKRRLG